MMITYHAIPAQRCRCPAKAFASVQDALHYAWRAADGFGVAYAVWHIRGGRMRLVKRLSPRPRWRLRA